MVHKTQDQWVIFENNIPRVILLPKTNALHFYTDFGTEILVKNDSRIEAEQLFDKLAAPKLNWFNKIQRFIHERRKAFKEARTKKR